MNRYFDIFETIPLFEGIAACELEQMLECVDAEIKKFPKGSILLLAGDKPRHVGIVIDGEIHITREDRDGNRSLLAAATSGQIFAEALCCAGVSESPVTVTADSASTVMMLSFARLLRTCPNSCVFHSRLIQNMLGLLANKNLFLQDRMEITSLKSVRAKVMRYLETFVQKQGSEITVPFNREQLSAYLCVERSALSHELARMKKDGLIDYKKNKFVLKNISEPRMRF